MEIIEQLYERVIAAGKLEDLDASRLVPESFDPEIHLRQMSAFVDTTGDFYGYPGLVNSTRELVRSFSNLVSTRKRSGRRRPSCGRSARNRHREAQWSPDRETRRAPLTLREGRVVRWEVFDDPADAFRAAGLSE